MKKYLKQTQPHANLRGAVESGDHSKNGASPKSLTSRRNLLKIFFVVAVLGYCIGCNKNDNIAPEKEQIIGIENIVSVVIPDGVIYTKTPKVELLNDLKLYDLLDEFKDFLYLTDINKYQIRLDVGNVQPFSESILVRFSIPDSLSLLLKGSKKATVIALIYQDGGEEILDNFEPVSSYYNNTNNTVEATLPFEVFTNARTGNYEAILSIALFDSDNNSKLYAKSSVECPFEGIAPVAGANITSGFGYRCHPVSSGTGCDWKDHKGIDYGAAEGTEVKAVDDGKVVRVKVNEGGITKGYGLYIIIDHGDGQTLYAHLKEGSARVSVGNNVKQGQIIALSGNTGSSTGPHLHFEYSSMNIHEDIKNAPRSDISTCLKPVIFEQPVIFELIPNELQFDYIDNGQVVTIKVNSIVEIEEVKSLDENICTVESSVFVDIRGDTTIHSINVFPKNNISPEERSTQIVIKAKINGKIEEKRINIIQEKYNGIFQLDFVIDEKRESIFSGEWVSTYKQCNAELTLQYINEYQGIATSSGFCINAIDNEMNWSLSSTGYPDYYPVSIISWHNGFSVGYPPMDYHYTYWDELPFVWIQIRFDVDITNARIDEVIRGTVEMGDHDFYNQSAATCRGSASITRIK
jgi:murein DD-endopeptidase MepM/ murein hydrolase activator NlpD